MSEALETNIELKARDPDPEATLARCRELEGGADHGELWQRDTYFAVADGRLKLREQQPGEPHLIHYHRAAEARARESRYRISAVPDAAACRLELGQRHGVRVTVTKRRRLFVWRRVRIHLDRVEQLGSFVELEAVADRGSDLSRERELVARLSDHLGIAPARIVAAGYAELLAGAGGGDIPGHPGSAVPPPN